MTTELEGSEGSASRPGCSLPPGKNRYPLYSRLGGPQDRSGQVRNAPTGIRSPDRPARNQSLYQLRYPVQALRSASKNLSHEVGFRIEIRAQTLQKTKKTTTEIKKCFPLVMVGHAVAQLVEAMCYKPEVRGFDSRWCHWNFSLT